jgi:hypothetical protein
MTLPAYVAADMQTHAKVTTWKPTCLTTDRSKAERWASSVLDQSGNVMHRTCVIEYGSWDEAHADYLKRALSLEYVASKLARFV